MFQALEELLLSGALQQHLLASLLRVGIGFAWALLIGLPLGLLLGLSRTLERRLFLPLEMLRTISPLAWIPFAMMWFGLGNASAIFIIVLACVHPLITATASAVRQTDRTLLEFSTNLGLSRAAEWQLIILPAALPGIFSGMRIALGVGWMVIVAAEMVGMRSGLGYLILDARNMLRDDMLVAAMLVIGFVGVVLNWSMAKIQTRLCWYENLRS